jgi:hypothetical protein
VGEQNLKVYITEFYKELFGEPVANSFSLMEERVDDISQLSDEENDLLIAEFTEKEDLYAISQMKLNKAPGPDGFQAEFYQKNWDVLLNQTEWLCLANFIEESYHFTTRILE